MLGIGVSAVMNGRETKKKKTSFDLMKSGTAVFRLLPTNLAHKCAIKALKFGKLAPNL